MMAPTGRNRRAGELLGRGHAGRGDPGADRPGLGGARRGAAAGRRRSRPPAARPRRSSGLAALIRGEIDAEAWVAGPAPGRALEEGSMMRTTRLERVSGRKENVEPAEPRPGRQGGARPRLRGALPGPPARRLLLRLLPGRQPARRRGPDRAGLPAGLPALRPGPARVRRAAAAALADPDRPQPRLQLLPRPLAPAADAAGRAPTRSPPATAPRRSPRGARSCAR